MTTPPQAAALTPPNGGNCATRGSDTPTTRPLKASCSAKPPPPPVWRAPEGPKGLAAVPVGGGRARTGLETRRIVLSTTGPTGAEGAGGTGGPGCGAGRRWRGLAAVLVGGGRARAGLEATRRAIHQRPSPTGVEGAGGTGGPGCGARGRWRGLAGLRGDAPSEARSADGSRAGRRPRRSQAPRPGHLAPGTAVGDERADRVPCRKWARKERATVW